MTIDNLAIAIQKEFIAIRLEMSGMASKEDLIKTKKEILESIDKLGVHISAATSRMNDDIAEIQDQVKLISSAKGWESFNKRQK